MKETKNYTLGRGRLFFSRFIEGTQTPEGFLYFGNTTEFNLTIESEDLPHYSSDEGIREKDDGVTLEVTRTGTIITDNISPDNVALFFFGEASKIAQATSGLTSWAIQNAKLGYEFLVGASLTNPVGVRGIEPSTFVVEQAGGVAATGTVTLTAAPLADEEVEIGGRTYKFVTALSAPDDVLMGINANSSAANLNAAINAGPGANLAYGVGTAANASVSSTVLNGVLSLTARATGTAGNAVTLATTVTGATVSGATLAGGSSSGLVYALDLDYKINFETGRLSLLETGSIVDGQPLDVKYSARAASRDRVTSGTKAIEGALMYEANNPKGKNFDYYMGYTQIQPNGDYALKGDEWQNIPFNLQVLRPSSGQAAILMDGRPAYE